MDMQRQSQLKIGALPPALFAPVHSGVLQRKCACGGIPGPTGECEACRKKREMALQRSSANRDVVNGTPRFGRDFSQVSLHTTGPAKLQTKLIANTPGDIYEREADQVADRVMAEPAQVGVNGTPLSIQRYSRRATGDVNTAAAAVDRVLAGSGKTLEPTVRQDMEQRFGHDFSQVRIHNDADGANSAQAMNARAYTVGQNIVFGSGEYLPTTAAGKRLLAHELVHVVQQQASGEAIQRTIGDASDLSSPRFAGDEVLEAVFDGERVLQFGDQGPAVVKVQQALIDAGFELPQFGADGDFKSETRTAVKAFQRAAGLEARQIDGIVGPNTMSRLDSRFPTADAPGPTAGCTGGIKTIPVDMVMLRGATGDPFGDIDFANSVFRQCCIRFEVAQGVTASPELSDSFLGGDTNLQMANCGSATTEELNMLLGSTAAFGLTSRIKVFYVASMTPSNQGSATAPLCATGQRAPLRNMVVIMNGHSQRVLAHEFAHILMNSFADHSVRADNLQHIDRGATGEKLEPVQCGIMFERS